MKQLTGAQALIECLKREKVKYIFGIPGGVLLAIYDVLWEEEKIKHVLVKHEQCAAHMADGYARATGEVGVCMATSGPGATNLVTGIANAYMDSIPIVAITGQVATTAIGKDSFQESDIFGITMPITKHNYLVKSPDEIPEVVHQAFYIARTGRPGPVLIDIPRDVSSGKLKKIPDFEGRVELRGYKPTYKGHPKQIREAAKAIKESQRPVIYTGGGIISSGASEELKEFAEKTNIPVTSTLLGLGGFPADHSLFLGMPGMHGTVYANYALRDADLIIAIGVRFDDRVTGKIDEFAKNAKVIHIDIDPAEISKNVKAHIPIVGDAKTVLKELIPLVEKLNIEKWHKQIVEWKEKYPLKYKKDENLRPQFVIEQINEVSKNRDTIVCTDVGQNQMWAALFYKPTKPRSFLSAGGLGPMGFALPSAIGAQIGCPKKLVFAICGDGGIQMVIQELATAVLNRLPIKICIINNRYLGMVRQWQELFFGKRYSQVCLSQNIYCQKKCDKPQYKCVRVPDFLKIAEGYEIPGERVTKPEEVKPALERALKVEDRPYLIDFQVYPEENVFPMIPAGHSVENLLLG
jgi:acetolactate synthase-1/2/3 large subunit